MPQIVAELDVENPSLVSLLGGFLGKSAFAREDLNDDALRFSAPSFVNLRDLSSRATRAAEALEERLAGNLFSSACKRA